MLKLYYLPGFCSLVSHVALEWTGAPYQAIATNMQEIKSPSYLKWNPMGAVPVLIDGDWVLTQSTAIVEYINELYPQAGIFGKGDLKARSRSRQWLAFAANDVHKLFRLIFGIDKFCSTEAGQQELIQTTSNLALRLLQQANDVLVKQDYLTDEITIADIYLYTILRWCDLAKLDYSKLAGLKPFYNRVEKDPGVSAVLKKEGI